MTGEVINTRQIPANVRLRELRENNNYSREEFAGCLDIDENNLVNLENGNRPMSANFVDRVCSVFDCTRDYLFGYTDNM